MGPDKFMEYLAANFNLTRTERTLIENILNYANGFEDEDEAYGFLSDMFEGTIGISDREVKMFSIYGDGEKNTRIEYLYRDADNYKVWNCAVIPGEISNEQVKEILDCLDDGEYFIPHLVGLPEKKFDDFDPEVDHGFFELGPYSFEETDEVPTVLVTPQELVEAFQAQKGNWVDAVAGICNRKCEGCENKDTCIRKTDDGGDD